MSDELQSFQVQGPSAMRFRIRQILRTNPVRDLESDEIFAELSDLGVHTDEVSYLRSLKELHSYTKIAEQWVEEASILSQEAKDFLYFSAEVLRERISPETFAIEDIDDLIQEGYDELDDNELASALDVWWQAWEHLASYVAEHKIRNLDDLDQLMSSAVLQSFMDWLRDFDEELSMAAWSDLKAADRKTLVVEQVKELFSETNFSDPEN